MGRTARAFLIFLVFAICVSGVVAGMVLAEYHTRAIGFGDDRPVLALEMQEDGTALLTVFALGLDRTYDITPIIHAWDVIAEFFSQFKINPLYGVF